MITAQKKKLHALQPQTEKFFFAEKHTIHNCNSRYIMCLMWSEILNWNIIFSALSYSSVVSAWMSWWIIEMLMLIWSYLLGKKTSTRGISIHFPFAFLAIFPASTHTLITFLFFGVVSPFNASTSYTHNKLYNVRWCRLDVYDFLFSLRG